MWNVISKVSGHMSNFLIVDDFLHKKSKYKRKYIDSTDFNVEQYNADIASIDLSQVIVDNDIDTIYDYFHQKSCKYIDKHVPIKVKMINEMKWSQKPWIINIIQTCL